MIMRLHREKEVKSRDNYTYYLDFSDYCDVITSVYGLPRPNENDLEPVTAYVSGRWVYPWGREPSFKVNCILELSVLSAKNFPNEQLPDFFNFQLIVGSVKDSSTARVFQNLSTLRNGDYVVEQCEFEQRSDVSGSEQMRRNAEGAYERHTQPIEYGPKKTTFLLSPTQYDSQYSSPGDHVSSNNKCLLHVQDGNFSLYKITAERRNFDSVYDGVFASAGVGKAYGQIQSGERAAAERKEEQRKEEQRKTEQAAAPNKAAFFNKETTGAATRSTTRPVAKPDNGCCPIL